jgi:hypothetical protein
MKNRLSVTIFIVLALIFLFPQPSLGIQTETCKECHGFVKPLDKITNDCTICHNQEDHQDPPSRRDREFVHNQHSDVSLLTQKRCTICHQQRPACTKCHNSHEAVPGANIKGTMSNVTQDITSLLDKSNVSNKSNVTNRQNASSKQNTSNISNRLDVSNCIGCHGTLPTPLGHEDFRNALSKSKHSWMNCQTCHINSYITGKGNNFGLHFKDLLAVPIDSSMDLCKICHSLQYNELQNSKHGDIGKRCVDCHNPHTTDFTGSKIVTPKETTNISSQIGSAEDWITTNIPIVKNTTAIYVIVLIIIATVAEHILSKDEEGKKTAYNTVKFHENEETLRTFEIKLKDQNINVVNEILEANGVNILGMTMAREEEYGDIVTYKYVIFGNITKAIDEDALMGEIATNDNVTKATFTDKYEL